MFREMTRKDRALGEEEIGKIIHNCSYGVLSLLSENGYPYGVPVNYAYVNGTFIIHGTNGRSHKMECIRSHDKVCLTIVDKQELIREEYTTMYTSVIVFGKAVIPEDPQEKMQAMLEMMGELAPEALEKVRDHCVRQSDGYAMILITPEHITGKAKTTL